MRSRDEAGKAGGRGSVAPTANLAENWMTSRADGGTEPAQSPGQHVAGRRDF